MKSEEELFELFCKDPSKIQNLCRVCLCEDPCSVTPLFNEDVTEDGECKVTPSSDEFAAVGVCEKLMMCGRVIVHKEDNLPKLICGPCHYNLDIAHLFRIKCQQADMLLRKVLISDTTENLKIINEKGTKDIIDDCKIKQEKNIDCDDFFDTSLEMSEPVVIAVKKTKKKRKQNSESGGNTDLNNKQNKHRIDDEDIILANLKIESSDSNLNNEENVGEFIEGDEHRYICEICNKSVKTKYILAKHLKVMHGEDRPIRPKKPEIGPVTGYGAERRFHCPECDYKCRRRQTLQYHMSIHTGEKPFQCDQCPKSFAQHASLYTHRKTHSDKTYYTCQECGRQFKHYGIFKNHHKVHVNEFNFVCTICNKAMKTQKTLNDHMNRHLQIKRYSCEYCGHSFVTQSCLILHLRVHDKNKERKYKCTFCEFSCHSKGALDVHIKRHTGVRNFPCESCNHMCYTRGELKTHSRKHTKEQNYACPLCEIKFRHSPSLNKHMLKKHGEKFKWSSKVDRRIVK